MSGAANKVKRVEFDNPTYGKANANGGDAKEDDEDEVERKLREENDLLEQQMSRAEKQFLDLMRIEKAGQIDIYQLNVSRYASCTFLIFDPFPKRIFLVECAAAVKID